jgi:hypothetical protein
MGTTGNTHTGGGAPERAMAERIAVTRTRAISNALEACACFDEAGESYWESEFKAGREEHLQAAVESARRGYDALERTRKGLFEASQMDLAFEDAHQKSPRLIKAHELGLNEYQYWPRRALGERLAYDRRMIDLIDHLLPTQDAVY